MQTFKKKLGIWWRIKRMLGIAVLAFVLPAATSATTINVAGVIGGGQLGTVNFDIAFTADFTVNHFDETAGVVVNSLTSTAFPGENPFALTPGPISFTYHTITGFFIFGGGASNVLNSDDTDIFVQIFNPLSTPNNIAAADSLATTASRADGLNIFVTVTEIAAIPLPAGLPLLLSAIVGMAGLKRIRTRRVTLSASNRRAVTA